MVSPGIFEVQKAASSKKIVNFSLPSCTCRDWERHGLPCKHFFAVFLLVPEWSWTQLPLWYTGSPRLSLDTDCVKWMSGAAPSQMPSHTQEVAPSSVEGDVDNDDNDGGSDGDEDDTAEGDEDADQSPGDLQSLPLAKVMNTDIFLLVTMGVIYI